MYRISNLLARIYQIRLRPLLLLVMLVSMSACSGSDNAFTDATQTCYNVTLAYPGTTTTKNLCTTRENGGFNGLGVSRFLRFSLASPSSVSIQVTRTNGIDPADPDIYIYKNGVSFGSAESASHNSESLNVSLEAADYVVEIREFWYVIAANKSQSLTARSLPTGVNITALPAAASVSSLAACTPGNDLIVSGTASFDRVPHNGVSLDYNNIIQLPVQQAVVSVICNGQVYSTSVTNEMGQYSLSFPSGQQSFVRVRAQMMKTGIPAWDFSVVDNTVATQPAYVMDSEPFTSTTSLSLNPHATSGWGGTAYIDAKRVAAPFAILDSVRKAKEKILFVAPDSIFPPLLLNWSKLNTTVAGDIRLGQIETSFFDGEQIFLLGAEDNDTDEYDEHVIIHEWGHYFEHNFSRSDSIGGPHTSGDVLDVRVAFGEGFGNAFSSMVTDNRFYIDVSGIEQTEGFLIDMEANNCVKPGWFSECSVQSILYDLYDTRNEFGVDNLSLGFTPIYNVMVGEHKNTPALTSIFSFIKPLKDQSIANQIDVTVQSQSIDPVLDVYGDSQISNDPGETTQLPLYMAF